MSQIGHLIGYIDEGVMLRGLLDCIAAVLAPTHAIKAVCSTIQSR